MCKSVSFVLVIFIISFSSPCRLNDLCFARSDLVIATMPVEAKPSTLVYNPTNDKIYSEKGTSLIFDETRMAFAHSLSDRKVNLKSSHSTIKNFKSKNKIIMYRDKIPIEVDYDKGVLIVQGKEIPIIVDGDVEITNPSTKDTNWVYLAYDRFDVYIEPTYYDSNTVELNLFFNRFEPRYELMETLTGWSSEKFYGTKLKIYVNKTNKCWEGGAIPGESHLFLYKNLSNPNVCWDYYYENGTNYTGNPGELGDHWDYMTGALHESLHSITTFPIYSRVWLAEGWSEYYEYNILSNYYGNFYPDINQETADYYIYQGNTMWNWQNYTQNDYRDGYNYAIQNSSGYDITAWMFSMLRDDYTLTWGTFYTIMDNNYETLDKAYWSGQYYTDTHVIDLFERATGTPMYPVFRYDGPSGPGWGVRNWTDLNWYADLIPVMGVSDTLQVPGESIWLNATIYNNGDVTLNDVVVRFYSNDSLINEQTTSVDSNGFVGLSTQYSGSEGLYNLRVVVDEDDLKIEQDDSNNEDSVAVSFLAIRGDANGDGVITAADIVYLINHLFIHGPAPVPLQAGDVNCDGTINASDVVYLINYLFISGPAPGC